MPVTSMEAGPATVCSMSISALLGKIATYTVLKVRDNPIFYCLHTNGDSRVQKPFDFQPENGMVKYLVEKLETSARYLRQCWLHYFLQDSVMS